jgi:hypothetical protein
MRHTPSCHGHCRCSAAMATSDPLAEPGVTRRQFLYRVGTMTAGGLVFSGMDAITGQDCGLPKRRAVTRRAIRVQPVLTYETPHRREATSWRNWGGIHTEQDAQAERQRIAQELQKLSKQADFPIEMGEVRLVKDPQQAAEIAKGPHDVLLLYAAGGGGDTLDALSAPHKYNLMFLRHDPGPAYLWYEIVHPRFLRKTVDEYGQPGWDVTDVVVDSQGELLQRFRALYGLKNTLGKRIVCIGGAAGWGMGGSSAPARTRELWKMDLVDYPYNDLAPRLQSARQNETLVKACNEAAGRYLDGRGVSLRTTREFVNNAFILTEVLKDVMEEAQTDAITINACMGTIMGMSQTTACLPLSMLNDEGYLAFCESDFVVIPSGVLLHYICGLPVFLNDPTYPHDNMVTLAHCTAPRRMDGKRLEPAKILTHFESDYGAAPKVQMRVGQICTNLIPDFASQKWVGFKGTIIGNPFLDICRSQIDVRVDGDCEALLQEMKGFHWMMSYGNYLRECDYALRKVGIDLLDVSPSK